MKKCKKRNYETINIVPIQISERLKDLKHLVIKNKIEKNQTKSKLIRKQKINKDEVLKYNDNELNDLEYKKAYEYDKRTFSQYYISLLFTKLILFKIFNKNDYNAYSIKVLLLFINFSSCYVVNALFFNDDTMHQIYEDEGDYNFIYQLPQIIYSSLISVIINGITSFLALSEDKIIELKKDKNLENIDDKKTNVIKNLKIKFIMFFIVSFIFILSFWYYLGCFCLYIEILNII